jgi:hypothetical protein
MKMMEQQMGVISVEKKEDKVISINKEIRDVHLEQKDVKTPTGRLSGFRNIESLLENPKNKEVRDEKIYIKNDKKHCKNYDIINDNYKEDEKEDESEKRFIMKEEDFPDIMISNKEENKEQTENKEQKENKWSLFNKDVDKLKSIGEEINKVTKEKYDNEIVENYNKMVEANYSIMKEQRLDDFIRKVKKNYDKEYVAYDLDTYIEDELRYYVDEEDITIEDILYEEMLEETKYREMEIDKLMDDNENYYKYYDEEAKYYMGD